MNHVYALRRTFSLIVILVSFLSFSFAQTTFTVTTTAATGPGSLDQAIQDANSTPGADNIVFNIAGPPPYVITPSFPGLPAITETVSIDGYTQIGASLGPIASRSIVIYINGATAGFSHGLTINADLTTISGLAIGGFLRNGIDIAGGVADVFIWGNFIGTDPTGLTAAGNNGDGISMGELSGGSDAIIIGTNSDGTNDDGEGNILSANGRDGILGWTVSNCIISGNFIGSDRFAAGTGFGNVRNGILLTVSSSANRIGTNGDNNNDVQELNGIIHNGVGIVLAAGSNLNAISGNLIGVQVPPTFTAAGNVGDGITIINSSNNRIGINPAHANAVAESNVISSNGGNGITISAQDFLSGFNTDPSVDNIVAGNFIGTTPLNDVRGNGGNGVSITSTDGVANTGTLIGSNNDGTGDNAESNMIANNSVIGVAIGNDPPTGGPAEITGATVSRNSIHDNGALGIDLVGTIGVTANDNGDGDTGPNELFNFPVITSNHGNGTSLRVTGISRPNSIIEVYLADGGGEGATFLFRAQEGTTLNGITDALAGTAGFSDPVYGTFTDNLFEFDVPQGVIGVTIPPGAQLVAIGIDPATGGASEFGQAALLLPVSLISFKGQLNDGVAKLSWTTSREINSSHFVIEKSIDGTNYNSVGQVNSGMLGGQYSFVDKSALGKVNYYRLRIVDTDLNYAFSKILIIRNDDVPVTFKFSPNPVSNALYISFKLDKEETVKLNIYDQMGRLTKRYNLPGGKGINAFTISDLGNLSAGNYVIELLGEKLSVREKIVKK